MDELDALHQFLSSVSLISRISFQLRRQNGDVVFSAGSDAAGFLSGGLPGDVFRHVVRTQTYRYATRNQEGYLCGLPIQLGNGGAGVILAFGTYQNGEGRARAMASHSGLMENFLEHLSDLVTENITAREEVEELALELDKRFEDLSLFAKIGTHIKTLRFSRSLLVDLISKFLENMEVDAGFAILPERREYNLQVVTPVVREKIPRADHFFETLIELIPLNAASLKEDYFIVNDSGKNETFAPLSPTPFRFLAVSIRNRKDRYGWLGLVSFDMSEIFRQGELRLLKSMAEQLAIVMSNTDLYRDLEQFTINMVKALVFAIEAKDIYTRGHSERVSRYAMMIGSHMGLQKKEHEDLKWASLLHDIGKIGMPESILNKSGRLTGEEYRIIRNHPAKGSDILAPVKQLAGALPGIRHHHERYDGTGYPDGLAGNKIPYLARIIAVADTYDAITSTRAYRGKRTPDAAIHIIEDVAGTQLDPGAVACFKEIYNEKLTDTPENPHAP